MSNTKYYLAAGALLCSAFSGFALTIPNTYAEGASSYFDPDGQQCIIQSYNAENGTSVTAIENVEFDKITALNCSGYSTGYLDPSLMPNLETLNISETGLDISSMDFSQNPKLTSINIIGTQGDYLFISKNAALENITTDRALYLNTIAYAEKTSDQSSPYKIDLSVLKFLDASSRKVVNFSNKNELDHSVMTQATFGGYTHNIFIRGGWIDYAIYFDNDEVEINNPENYSCTGPYEDGSYWCGEMFYSGDEIDTDDIIQNTLSKVFNLDGYSLAKTEMFARASTVPVPALSINTNTRKKGIAPANADYIINFYFSSAEDGDEPSEESDSKDTKQSEDLIATPDTGFGANDSNFANVALAYLLPILVGISTSIFAFFRIKKYVK